MVDVSHEDFQERVRDSLEEFGPKPSEGPWEEFRSRLRFAGGGFEASDPGGLLEVLEEAEKQLGGAPQRVHYFAVPPSAFAKLTEGIGAHGLAERSRVVYEKPFGTSMETFKQLDKMAHAVFQEQQIYRIDHFLGKEATQSIHVARFANGLFSRVWDRRPHRQRADRRPRDPRRWDAGQVLRLDRRHPRHAGHPPVPAGRRGLHEDAEVL